MSRLLKKRESSRCMGFIARFIDAALPTLVDDCEHGMNFSEMSCTIKT
jgi:hypothetical protein